LDADVLRAHAQNVPLPPNPAAQADVSQSQYIAVNSYFDANSLGGRSVGAGATFAPFGLNENGVLFGVGGSASWYRFLTSRDPEIIGNGHYIEGSVLAGYGVSLPRFSFSWMVGPAFGEAVNEGVITDRWGAAAVISMYAVPTDQTMASASASYSTIGNDVNVQGKAGLKVFNNIYFGPEGKFSWRDVLPYQTNFSSTAITFTRADSSRAHVSTVRAGAHLSALSFGPLVFGISGGWVHDRNLGNGYYGSVWLYQPF
jgi:hypothetical protein